MLQKKKIKKVMLLSAAVCSMSSFELSGQELHDNLIFNDIDSIKIISAAFDIITTGYDGDHVEAQFYYQDKYYNVLHETRGQELTITTKEKRVFSIFNCHGKILLKVPFSVLLDISTTSGTIEVTDSRGTNRLQTTSGAINIHKGSGDKQVSLTSGNLAVTEVKGNLMIDSTSGSILIDRVEGPLKIDAASGITDIRETKGAMSIHKMSGRITGENIFAEGMVDLNTTSGNISMDFRNPIEELSFIIKTNSGRVRVGESKGAGNMIFGNGSTAVRFSTTSGNIDID